MTSLPMVAPIFPAGKEPLPPGITDEEKAQYEQMKRWQGYTTMAMESCVAKTAIAGVGGFAIGAFFSLMSASFAYEDPLLRDQMAERMNTKQKTVAYFKDMGKGMYRSGSGFAKVGALFAGIECVIESYRAKNDMVNPVAGGFIVGGILARNSGPKGALLGGLGFSAFSAAIDMFLRREPADDD